jgi:putative tryptophan/tyrosine transport system substrate-binding protein
MQLSHLKRRQFITLLGGAAVWPLAARAQQSDKVRRIGVLMSVANGPEGQARLAAFLNGLRRAGWIEGRNVRIDQRWGAGDPERARKYAVELVALGPDVILASGDHSVVASQQATRTVPIVFTVVSDPVGTGYVASLARPGGNMTGFTLFEYSTSAKYLEVLKEIAPGVKRAAVVREAGTATGTGQFAAIQAAAPALGVELSAIGVRDAGEIEGSIAAFARFPNGGLIVTGSAPAAIHSDLIVALAAHHKLPAAYFARFVVAAGGLISYGPDFLDVHRRPAAYVDRILKGEKPADLPVQAPTKYELTINLKTAKALGLDVPQSPRRRGDRISLPSAHRMLLHLLTAGFSVLPCTKSVSSVPRAVIRRKIVLQKRTPVNAHDCQSIWKGARSRFEANHLWEQPTQETRL